MSPRLSKVSPAVSEIFRELLQRWPNHKKDEGQLALYVEDIADLVENCGPDRVRAAVKAARIRCDFLPEAPELNKLLPGPERHSEPLRDPDCLDCAGDGWKMVRYVDVESGRAGQRATRCTCRPPAALKTAPRPSLRQYNTFIAQALKEANVMAAATANCRTELEEA